MQRSSLILTFTLVVSQFATAQIVQPDVQASDNNPLPESTFQLSISDSPSLFGSTTWFALEPSGTDGVASLRFTTTDLGVGREWYSAGYNQPFSCSTVGDFARMGGNEFPIVGNPIDVPLNEDFYLAVNTGFWSDDTLVTNYEYFGWVQLNVDDNLDVTAVDSAFSLSCEGILIGRNVVPEPRGSLMALFGAVLLLARRRT